MIGCASSKKNHIALSIVLTFCSKKKDLGDLSSLGHFLKGSSATLGLYKVQNSCEKIQNWGAGKNETGDHEVDDKALCLQHIKDVMPILQVDFKNAKKCLEEFYDGQE